MLAPIEYEKFSEKATYYLGMEWSEYVDNYLASQAPMKNKKELDGLVILRERLGYAGDDDPFLQDLHIDVKKYQDKILDWDCRKDKVGKLAKLLKRLKPICRKSYAKSPMEVIDLNAIECASYVDPGLAGYVFAVDREGNCIYRDGDTLKIIAYSTIMVGDQDFITETEPFLTTINFYS